MRKKQNRPTTGLAKDEYLELRLFSQEKKAFKDAADLSGMALSVWVRERLRRASRVELEEAGKPIAFME